MPKNPHEFAELFGAKIVGEAPAVGGGPFGMARLANILHQRLTPSQGARPGRPTDSTWVSRPKVPMSEETMQKLAQIAEQMSTPERRVSPMQVAAQLLEEGVGRVQIREEAHLEQNKRGPEDLPSSEQTKAKAGLSAGLQEETKIVPEAKHNVRDQARAKSTRRRGKT